MKKTLLIASICLTFSSQALKAQLPVFSKSTSTYAHLTGATRIAKDSVWDDFENWRLPLQKIPLGFTFHAFGHNIDTFLLRDGAVMVNFGNSDTVIYIGSDFNANDFCDKGYGTKNPKSPIWWKREGSAGDRILKLEWQNFGFYEDFNKNGTLTDSGNLQMWIYENGNKVEMRFGQSRIANFSKTFPSKAGFVCAKYDQMGRTSGFVLDGTASNPTSKAYADTSAHGVTSWPANGQIYTFSFIGAVGVKPLANSNGYYFSNGNIIARLPQIQSQIEIYSTEGKLVYSGSFSSQILNVAPLKTGIYTAKITGNNSQSLLRFYQP